MKLLKKIENIIIENSCSLLQALKTMDLQQVKLLMILSADKKLLGLISIGDIQRAIINNMNMDTPVSDIQRKTYTVCTVHHSIEEIKNKMVHFRTEYMPIVDDENNLMDVIFWNENFELGKTPNKLAHKIPVVIMAGGFGSRLKPLTNVIPKPLIPIGDRTISEEIVSRFEAIGVTDFYFTVNYKKEIIKFYFDQIENKKYQIEYLIEEKPLGTAGSLFLLKDKIKTPFFVSNCDILIDEDYTEIYNYHTEHKNQITIVASLKHISIPYGTIESGEKGELISLKEKPEIILKINTGMYILEPEVLDFINENEHIHITELIEKVKNNNGKVGVFPVSELSWVDMGEWKSYDKLIEKYK